MLKVALLATAMIVAASTAAVEKVLPEPAATPAGSMPCHQAPSPPLACALRAADADGDGSLSATELANLVVPAAPLADWMPWHPAQDAGLDFKDAAAEPGSMLPMSLDRERTHPAIPALFAVGALVILLRRRPT